jgi:hypothetical protein
MNILLLSLLIGDCDKTRLEMWAIWLVSIAALAEWGWLRDKKEHPVYSREQTTLELEHESDGRWICEIPEIPGVMCYGKSPLDAVKNALILAENVGKES